MADLESKNKLRDTMMTDAIQVWGEICSELGKKVGNDVVDRWLSDARICSLKSDCVKLEFPTRLHVDWVETYYRGDLLEALSSYFGSKPQLVLRAKQNGEDAEQEDGAGNAEETGELIVEEGFVKSRQEEVRELSHRLKSARLNSHFSLGNFVVGHCNLYAHATALSVIDKPGEHPVLFFGKTGVGKTHLMSALGQEVLGRYSKKRVLFVTGEEFTNEFIEAVQRNRLPQFRAKYRKVDVLLIDDVQFLGGKQATQDEFFHTFNTLINSRSQIVLTTDQPPSEIPSLEPRLLSRFQGGISAEIQPPGLETRIAILRQKAHEKGVELDSHVIEFLASKIHKNVRNLESALLRISTYMSLYRQRVTVAQAEDYLRDILAAETRDTMVTITLIQKEVAEYFDVPLADLNGRSRSASIVEPRQVAMFLSREMTHSSLKEIGRAFGGRDHGTVIHACKKVADEAQTGGESKRVLDYLRSKIAG